MLLSITVTDFENVSSKLLGSVGPSRGFLQLAPVIWTESEALRVKWALLANLNLCAGLQVGIKGAVHQMTAWENAVVAYSSHQPVRFADAAEEMAIAEGSPHGARKTGGHSHQCSLSSCCFTPFAFSPSRISRISAKTPS